MKHYALYSLATGIFDGRTLALPESMLKLNTPPGMGALEGHFDPRSQRVDLETGEVVAWHAPPPSQAESEAADLRAALQRAGVLEKKQGRSIRALLLDPNDSQARARLTEIESQILALGIRRS